MPRKRPRVLVFGIDGGTLSLVGPWAKRGELPNLARLMGDGAAGVLRSTVHPLTPQAWCSFLTGMNPGKHGVFDFGKRRATSYDLELTDSTTRRAPAIWSYLEEHDLTTGVVNVPMTFPLEPVHGFMVSGMHSPSVAQALGPRSLMQDIQQAAPDYRIDVMSPWYTQMDEFLRDVHQMAEARTRLVTHLYDTYKPDLYMVVMVLVDRVCHALYKQSMDPKAHNRDGRADWKYSGEVLRAYKVVDDTLGQLMRRVDDETVIIVMSDHGFGTLERDVNLNQFFLEQGLMSFSVDKVRPRLPVVGVPPGGAGRTAAGALLATVAEALPPLRRRQERAIRRGQIPLPLRRWEYVDWERTLAYSQGLFGNVSINLRGREPEGCVDPADYERVRERVAAALTTLTDPQDGSRVVDHVYRREELYSGPYLEEAPDLLVVMRDYAYMTRGGNELTSTRIVDTPAVNHSGNHRLNGMLVMWGPGVRRGLRLRGSHIMDVMPTILQILGLPIPREVDGRVLGEALEHHEQLSDLARKLVTLPSGEKRLTRAEEELIRTRLKNLGYFE
jgi:predicted AlkP superfamily phosphohydrolase/phosphomutase